jgi:hypothetical protein
MKPRVILFDASCLLVRICPAVWTVTCTNRKGQFTMSTEVTDLETMLKRLDRVEHQNSNLKRTWTATVLGVLALVLMGQSVLNKVPEVLEAQKFVLRDSQGRGRAMLGFTPENSPVLILNQTDGTLGATLKVGPQGQPMLSLYDKGGNPRALLSVDTDGSAGLTFGNADGKARAGLAVTSEKSAGLILYGNGEKALAVVGLTRDGSPAIIFADEHGKPNLVIANTEAQAGLTGLINKKADFSMSIVDKAGKVIWSVP